MHASQKDIIASLGKNKQHQKITIFVSEKNILFIYWLKYRGSQIFSYLGPFFFKINTLTGAFYLYETKNITLPAFKPLFLSFLLQFGDYLHLSSTLWIGTILVSFCSLRDALQREPRQVCPLVLKAHMVLFFCFSWYRHCGAWSFQVTPSPNKMPQKFWHQCRSGYQPAHNWAVILSQAKHSLLQHP